MILGRRPIERRRRSYFLKPPAEDPEVSIKEDPSILGSIRLYKRAARMSGENVPLLPTEEGRRRGLSAIKEVTTSLKARFTPDLNPTDFDTADFDTADLVSSKEIIEELRY
jgi:hypothetical protein